MLKVNDTSMYAKYGTGGVFVVVVMFFIGML
jgi:hypothetical protein